VQPKQPSPLRVSLDDIDWTDELQVTFNGEPVTGEVVDLDQHGRPIEVVTYDYGIQEGLTRRFYPDGSVQFELWYEVGIPVGVGRTWYENGQLQSETRYSQGNVVEKRTWAEDGTELTGGIKRDGR
jgi:antitoxin component YwqK of YwqJK toxin-antitoxin module